MKSFLPALVILTCFGQKTLAVDSVVVFNEVHYHPPTNEAAMEWIELHNQMAVDIDVSAWFIEDGVEFTFAEGTIIPGGGYLVIAGDVASLQNATGATNVVGPFTGRLNNGGEQLQLRDRNGRLMDELVYGTRGKWPVAADGSGATLAKRDPNATSRSPENWTSSIAVGGTPGARNFPEADVPRRRSLIAFDALWRYEASGTDLGESWRQPDFDDSTWAGRNNATLISYWPFDGNANATRGVNGTFVGAVSAAVDRNGAAGGALAFSGAQQYVQVAGGGGLNAATAGTISLWVKWAGNQDADCCSTFGAVLARQANGQFSDDIIALNAANPSTARVVWRQAGGPAPVLITSTAPVGTNWHHLAITFTTASSTLYVDGISQGTAVGGGLNNNPTTPLSIGAWAGDGGGFASASIDDVAIWDRPLSAGQIAQLANQSKAPLDFASPESAVYFAGDGRLATNDELRRTQLPLGPTTYYFRHAFRFDDDPTLTELNLDLAADDGAVIYLNGTEIHRHNMPMGDVVYSTLATSEVGDAPLLAGTILPATSLVRGTNVLAVEVHQAGVADAGMAFGASLTASITPAPVFEDRTLIGLQDPWRFDASNADLGSAWRAPAYIDVAWSNGPALFFAGDGEVDGVPPELIRGVTATASSQLASASRFASNAVNGAGLVGNAHVNTPDAMMWLNNGTFVVPNDLSPRITFDLGSVVPVRSMKVWNYNEDLPGRPELLSRGVASADVLVSTNTTTLNVHIAGQAFNKAPGTQTDFSQVIDLGNVSARYVRLDKLTNFPGGDFRFVGLSEVQFFRDAQLKRTELPFSAVTYYFRKAFLFGGDPSRAELTLNAAVDDGAVFYLNGVEVYRHNMPSGTVSHSTLASSLIDHATFTGPVPISAAHLKPGTNVLAVEVHQTAAASDMDMIFGLSLAARIAPRPPEDFEASGLVFNEIGSGNAMPFQLELVNRGGHALDLSGYVLRRAGSLPDAEFSLPPQTLAPGEFLILSQAATGLGANPGEKLFLVQPNGGIADAVQVAATPRGRWPDGAGEWLTPNATTFGASNSFTFHQDVVINEIMYHHRPTLEVPPVIGTNAFITLTNWWRYEQSDMDLGTAWRAPGFDDSAWPVGQGLFVSSTNNLPMPKNTELALGPTAYYFRTAFEYTGAQPVLTLSLRHIVDDGAAFYLNGVEIARFNLPAGVIRHTNTASPVLNAQLRNPITVALSNLVVGVNVLAVEVHQASPTGDDVAFGAELGATVEAIPRVPYSESDEQWVELLNRGSNAVDLTGWRLDEGIDFRFAPGTMIPANGYLVVAKDPEVLRTKYSNIAIAGPYTNSLSHRGERIVLKDRSDNPADSVSYFDREPWPDAADAGGSSMELRDPFADNNAAGAWAASDEGSKSAWRTYSYRGVAAASAVGPDGQWREFVMGLLNAGEVWLDDISVIETPATTPVQLIQNGTFDTGTNKWRIIGNHHGEVIDDPSQPGNKILRLIATGATEHMSNHGETTLANGRDTVNTREYLISFRAKWISGSRQFHTRLYFNRLARTTLLDAPEAHGTPGTRNTAFAPNIGPTYQTLRHAPAVPAPFTPVMVSVQASDPDGLAGMTLWWRQDGASWQSTPMIEDPLRITHYASLPGRPAGAVVQFYVEGRDLLGATSWFPPAGPASRALYKVDDGLAATNGLHNVRLVVLAADADALHRTVNLMSNERIGTTFIYDEREIVYDAALRLKGSEHSRTTSARLGFNVSFPGGQLFRGVHTTVALDRSESTGYGQREMLIHQTANHVGGVPTKYHDLVQIMTPRLEHTGAAELQLARYSDVFLDDQFDRGREGTVFEYELVYQLNSTDTLQPEGNKVPAPDSVVGTTIRNLGNDKEAYRWDYLIKNNEERDDYSRIMDFCRTMELAGTNFNSQITNVIDVDQWLRGTALCVLSGAGDNYGGDGSQHNVQFYVRPEDRRVLFLPHDVDAFFDANRPILPNGDITKLIAVPAHARTYYGHLRDMLTTTYNSAYLSRWAAHYGRLLPGQNFASHLAFIVQRATLLNNSVNGAIPNAAFAITTSAGNNFSTSNQIVTIAGTAPLAVKTIEVNGVAHPITWTSTTVWTVMVSVFNGINTLNVQGRDRYGRLLTNALDAITVTNTGPGALFPVVINEWMADNAGPGGVVDPLDGLFQDWFELFNPNTNGVSLTGFHLTDNLSQPTKFKIPSGTVIGPRGFLFVWADNQPEQNAADPNGHLHASFALNNGGEAIALFNPVGVAQHVIVFEDQTQNVSQGLFPDGDTNAVYFMTNWTPRASNVLGLPVSPQILTVRLEPAGQVALTFSATPGRSYRIEFKEDLAAEEWLPLGQARLAGGTMMMISDALDGHPQRFYRAVLVW